MKISKILMPLLIVIFIITIAKSIVFGYGIINTLCLILGLLRLFERWIE